MNQVNTPNLPIFNRIEKDDCCGCEACINSCPQGIVSMQPDEEGFFFPFIDEEKCTNCNLCVSVCPSVNKEKEKPLLHKAYAGYALDKNTVLSSSSGGLFTIIASEFIKNHEPNGYVAAVVWNDNFKSVHHICSNDLADIERMRGSKYVQSHKDKIYNEVKEKLNAGAYVLFVGCPCEVVALKKIVGDNYTSLYTIDLVCKGPTSEKVLSEFLERIEKKAGALSAGINMRHVGWNEWIPQWIKVVFKNNKKYLRVLYGTDFGRGFYIMQRKACYQCSYSHDFRASDITLGDFHGAIPGQDYYNRKGTSIIIANTIAGEKMIHCLKNLPVKLVEVDYNQIALYNPCMIKSGRPHEQREKFSKAFVKEGLHQAVKYTYPSKERLINILPPNVSKKAYKILRKIKDKFAIL